MVEENKTEELLLYLDMGDILDQDQLDELTRQLQDEILDQDVESAEMLRGDEIPEGAKSADAITWGAIALNVLPPFLPSLVNFLQSWTMRGENRKIKVKSQIGENSIELEYSPTSVSNEEIKELVSILTSGMQTKEVQPKEDKKSGRAEK